MNPIFPELPAELGVYTLTQLLGSHETYDRYIARQSHVERSVVIEVLRPGCSKETLDAFLRRARLRVAARLPQVSQVLETMVSGDIWYITSECPEGVPLSRMREEDTHLSTVQSCTLVRNAAILYEHCARKNLAAEVLKMDAVFVSENGEVTFLSPLVAGSPTPEMQSEQLDGLAALLLDLGPKKEAGQTRVATLIEWLGQEFDGGRMEWQAVSSAAEYIRDNVAPPSPKDKKHARVMETDYMRKRRLRQRYRLIRQNWPAVAGMVSGAAALSLLGLAIAPLIPVESLPAIQGNQVFCRAEKGNVVVMGAPVSIWDYKEFLNEYVYMSQARRNAVNDGVPGSDEDHTPKEWERQLWAVESNGKWHGRSLTWDSPVCGISYWDAVAYANYRAAFLPSANLLHTVRQATGNNTVDEWSDTEFQNSLVYLKSRIVLTGNKNDVPRPESDFSAKATNRSFRLVYPAPTHPKP